MFIPAETSKRDLPLDLVVIIHRGQLLCPKAQPWQLLAAELTAQLDQESHRHYLGSMDGRHVHAIFFSQPQLAEPQGYQWQSLRAQLGVISEELFQLAGRALQITLWYRNHQYCGACGAGNQESESDRALVCVQCSARYYPRISPCVIGLVQRGDMCLLARGAHHPEGVYSTLAGFIEPGESAEQAFAREVKEEVNIDINNIQYFTSQPWPFPGQLMLGFTADYASGELRPDKREIIDARWYTVDTLPKVSPPSTIAGQLIRQFIDQQRG